MVSPIVDEIAEEHADFKVGKGGKVTNMAVGTRPKEAIVTLV